MLFILLLISLEMKPGLEIDLASLELFRAGSFAVLDDGGFVLPDYDEQELVFLDARGHLMRRTGGRGQGPGEFLALAYVHFLPKERVIVAVDYGNRRFSRFNLDGTFRDAIPFPGVRLLEAEFLDGRHILTTRNSGGRQEGPVRLVKVDTGQDTEKVLWEKQLSALKKPTMMNDNGNLRPVLMDWDPIVRFAIGNTLLAVNWGEEPDVHLIDHQGRPAGSLSVRLPQRRLEDAEVATMIDKFPARSRASLRQNLVRPEFWPMIRKILIDDRDRIWVFGFAPKNEPVPYQVFDGKGKQLDRGELPQLPIVIRNETCYTIEERDDHRFLVGYDVLSGS